MPPRRRHRGHVEQLPSGSFRAIVDAGTDLLSGRRAQLKETHPTRAEAETALTRMQRQVDEQQHPKSAITVNEAVDQWFEVADLEVTTRERYEDLIRIYIRPTLGHLQAGRIDAELLERFYARLHRCRTMCSGRPPKGHKCEPLSTSTTRKIHYIIRGAFGLAVRWKYLNVNPAELTLAPSPAKTEPDPPSATEAAALLGEAFRDPEWGLLIWLTMVTGCRRGELCALRWRDLDVEKSTLWIQRSAAQTRTGIHHKDTKSGQQRRISIDEHTMGLLAAHRVRVGGQLAKLRVRGVLSK
jgi:integrase